MAIEIGFTHELTNTNYAALAVVLAHYQQNQVLEPLTALDKVMRERDFRVSDKLAQILVSLLADCERLVEVNSKLEAEWGLALVMGWPRMADQSSLSRTLDALQAKDIALLRDSTTRIWRRFSRIAQHDWRGRLWLDFDLSGLPCGPLAEASQKGYFGEKKTSLAAS